MTSQNKFVEINTTIMYALDVKSNFKPSLCILYGKRGGPEALFGLVAGRRGGPRGGGLSLATPDEIRSLHYIGIALHLLKSHPPRMHGRVGVGSKPRSKIPRPTAA
jgi:hypothetical protein